MEKYILEVRDIKTEKFLYKLGTYDTYSEAINEAVDYDLGINESFKIVRIEEGEET